MSMKWHPADKAREAEKQIQKIDPVHGYKIKIVRDESVPAPPMPKTPPLTPSPPSLNMVLMRAAQDAARQKKIASSSIRTKKNNIDLDSSTKNVIPPKKEENEAPGKKEEPTPKQALQVYTCLGCGLATCLNKHWMETAVASYRSLKSTEKVCMMTREERVEWFVPST